MLANAAGHAKRTFLRTYMEYTKYKQLYIQIFKYKIQKNVSCLRL